MFEMEVFRFFSVIFLRTIVTGLDFSFSRQNVLLNSDGTLTMTCSITETDVGSVYLFQIRRLRDTTLTGAELTDWTTLALIEPGETDTPSLDPAITASDKDYVAGGSWDSTNPSSAVLTLSMNIQKLVCADARYYMCQLSYKSSTAGGVTSVIQNTTFTAYVKPQVKSLDVRGFIGQGLSSTNPASVNEGDELELTCNAQIGSRPGTLIRWRRTSETASTNDFIGYQPPQGTYDEGTATSDNQCGYTRVATIRYNATPADAINRDNNLAFECYVTVSGDPYGSSYTSENNPQFYADVTSSDDDNTDEVTSAGGSDTAAIVGGIVGGLVVIVIIVLLVYFLWYRRQSSGDDCPEKQFQHHPGESQDIGLSNLGTTADTYEQLQNRTVMENMMEYESLRGSENQVQHHPEGSQAKGLSNSGPTPDTYEQLQERAVMENTITYESLRASPSEGQGSQSHYENF